MRTIKSFDKYFETVAAEPATKPTTKPVTKPTTKPGTKERPHNPIRRDKPSVEPAPKAKATEKDVVNRFQSELKRTKAKLNIDTQKLKNRYK